MKTITWGWPTTIVVLLVIVILTASLPMPSCTKDSPESATPKVEWPRAYLETINPDREEFVYPAKDEWLAEPVHVPKGHWGWFNFVDQNISDDRVYVRCANALEGLDGAEVILWNINSPKEIFSNTGCRYFDMKLPPDTRVGNPVVSFRISKMR
ncbi:MAG: hypothetical protein PHX25_00410 [Candidatus Pacebacteria bacterium]|nr:hypothetical protein [Candidatus Paceibacterota bacterium]